MTDIPWTAIVPAVSALAGVWLANALSAQRSHRERLWEKRREAYSQSIAALLRLEDRLGAIVATVERDGFPGDQASNPSLARMIADLEVQSESIKDVFRLHQLMFSADAQAIVERADREFVDPGDNELPAQRLRGMKEQVNFLKRMRSDIEETVRNELKLGPSSFAKALARFRR